MSDYLDAASVMKLLGIKKQTLYAYASRGLLTRVTHPGSQRSLYLKSDAEKLLRRKLERDASGGALNLTALAPPITAATLSSFITEIGADGLRYRGRDVRALAVHPGYLENIAELLWTGVLPDEPAVWDVDSIPTNMEHAIAALQPGEGRVPILRVMATASLVLGESSSAEVRYSSTTRLARRLITAYAGCLGYVQSSGVFCRHHHGESLAELSLRALTNDTSFEKATVLNSAMIWCADHELSTAAYTARVVASAGVGLHACLVGALSAHSGDLLGGACDRIEAYIESPPDAYRLRQMISRVKNGGRFPGMGNPLYPDSDPRALALLELAEQVSEPGCLSSIRELLEVARSEANLHPSLEMGLVALCRALKLPRRSATGIWAVARSVGWVAHVIEQRLTGTQIRPRSQRSAG